MKPYNPWLGMAVALFVLLTTTSLVAAATSFQAVAEGSVASQVSGGNPPPDARSVLPRIDLMGFQRQVAPAGGRAEGVDSWVTPGRITATLDPGETHQAQIHVFTGDAPFGKGDVMFVFDRTSSMGDEINQVKASAVQIMNEVRDELPNTWFGVASFMDYPGYYSYPGYSAWYGSSYYGDTPWELNMYPTTNITDVASAINSLWLGYGQDTPEDYSRVLHELSQIQSVGWRAEAKRIAVLFGDAPTHDTNFAGYNTGGDPGRDEIAQTDDDIDFETVVQQVADRDISVIAVDSGYSAASEATFKGMSIGYATAPGTNGRYFRLNDVSAIPSATVDLIISETQVIDRLSLRVTEGFEDWLQVDPPAYLSVATNVTKTFDVAITVPAGTASGFYPFLIQAIGDGAILGITYVEVTVPASSAITDLGFRPDPDGFRFKNFASTLSWEMFRQFFGAEQVEYPNGNRIHAADLFYQRSYRDSGGGGSCDGFSATSMFNYMNLDQPNAGAFAMPRYTPLYPQRKSSELEQAITFAQGIQMGLELNYHGQLMCEVLGKSPSSFYNYLKSMLQNNSPAVVGIRWHQDYTAYVPPMTVLEKGGAHALIPYRFEEESTGDRAYVYVYDSNLPGNDSHRLEFDLTNDTWSYRWPVPLWPDITIEGDASVCSLAVAPLEMYRHSGVSWWSLATRDLSPLNPRQTSSFQLLSTKGPVKLLMIDDEGRRLGWDGAQFFDEIPRAGYWPIQSGGDDHQQGLYLLPTDLLYDLQIRGQGTGDADITALGEGYAVELSALHVMTDTVLGLRIPAAGGGVAVFDANTTTSGTLVVSQMLADEDHTIAVGDLAFGPDETLELRYEIGGPRETADLIQLTTDSGTERTYSLSLQRAGGDGFSVYGHADLTLDRSSSVAVRIDDWSNLPSVVLEIDLDGDGIPDYTVDAGNEAQPASIAIDAGRSTINAGGDEAALIISVKDQFQAYVADGTPVSLTTNQGSLSIYQGNTTGGLVHATLRSGDTPGPATVTAHVGALTASITIDIAPATRRTYLPLIEKQPIMSAVPSWRAGSGLADHVVYQLSSTSATCNVLFAGADNGAYRSGDGGQTWTPVLAATAATWRPQRAFDGAAAPSSALTPSVAVCPANPNVVYLTRWGEGVYRSQDDGATWQPRNGGLGDLWIYALAVSPANCDIVYAATNEHGVWQSTNGGVSWQPRNNGLGNLTSRSIALAPGNPQRLFVGTTGGIWRSDNGGSSWAPTAGLPAATVWSLAVASNDPGQVLAAVEGAGVYTSINAGVSWQERNTGLSSRRVRTLAIDPADAQHVVVGIDQGGGVYHSSDGGQNWTPLNDGLGNRNVKRIWLAGGMCDRLHAGTTNGAWYYQP